MSWGRKFDRRNRADSPNREYRDSDRGFNSQNNRSHPYQRPCEISHYGNNSQNYQSAQGNREYDVSSERCFNSGLNDFSSGRGDYSERSWKNSNEPRHDREYSNDSRRYVTGNDSYNSSRNEIRNYSRSPRRETGNNNYGDSRTRETNINNPRLDRRSDSYNSRDETRKFSSSPTHRTGNYSNDSRRYEARNDRFSSRDETQNYFRSPTHQTDNSYDSRWCEAPNDIYSSRDEIDFSDEPRHEPRNYSGSPIRDARNDLYNLGYEGQNDPYNPREETRNYSRSPTCESTKSYNKPAYDRGNYSNDQIQGYRNDSYNPRDGTRNYSRSPRRDSANNFKKPAHDRGNNSNDLRQEIRNNPSSTRDKSRNYSNNPRSDMRNYFKEPKLDIENQSDDQKQPREHQSDSRNFDIKVETMKTDDVPYNEELVKDEPFPDNEEYFKDELYEDNLLLAKPQTKVKEDGELFTEIPLTTFDEESDEDEKDENEDAENEVLPGPEEIKHMNCHNKIMENNFLDQDSKVVLIFLSHAFYNVFIKGPHRMHCDLLSNYFLGHRNALKLYRYEVRQSLEERYRQEKVKPEEVEQRKRTNLRLARASSLLEMNFVFKDATEEEKVSREKLLDECIDLIAADTYPEELVPVTADYLEDPNKIQTEAEMKKDFQLKFVEWTYSELGFKLVETLASIKDLLSFHFEVISALLVEMVRTYVFKSQKTKPGDQVTLPAILKNYLKHEPLLGILRNHSSRMIFEREVSRRNVLETEIMDFLPPGTNLSPSTLVNFANSILYFDQVMTVVRLKLVTYTPFIALSPYAKLQLFDETLRRIYSDVLELWKNKTQLSQRTFNIVAPAKVKATQ